MDRLRASLLRNLDDRIAAQVRILRPRAANRIRGIGQAHVLRIGVGFGEHRNAANA